MWQEELLNWYETKKRALPWRDDPTAYHVWISEIMLQQTRVEAVKHYYERFLETLPDIVSLANVEEEVLLKLWEGLGYYTRARNLKKAANIIVDCYGGKIPDTFEELLMLPGIGRYTAGAIASIAYGKSIPVVDGNVLRVMSRLQEDHQNILEDRTKQYWENFLKDAMQGYPPREFNQALMELGAMVCGPNGSPACDQCPLQQVCKSYQHQTMLDYPKKAKKKARKIEERTILLLFDGEKIALHKRDNTGLLAGLWEFPNLLGHRSSKEVLQQMEQLGMYVSRIEPLEATKHIFSHIEWHMIGYSLKVTNEQPNDYIWVRLEELKNVYSLPTAFKTYASYFINLLSTSKRC